MKQEIIEKIKYVAKYVGTETNDWIRVKKEILNTLPPKDRKFFSRRHKTSKKHFINDFEKEIIIFWKSLTGIELQIPEDKLHKKSDERPHRYWGLMKYNEERKKRKQNEQRKT